MRVGHEYVARKPHGGIDKFMSVEATQNRAKNQMKKAPPEADQPAAETGNRKKKEASRVVRDLLIDQNMGAHLAHIRA
jgi:hypothetical protein